MCVWGGGEGAGGGGGGEGDGLSFSIATCCGFHSHVLRTNINLMVFDDINHGDMNKMRNIMKENVTQLNPSAFV